MSDVLKLVPSVKPKLWELQDDLNKLFTEKYGDLTVAESLGVLEMFKWEYINGIGERDE